MPITGVAALAHALRISELYIFMDLRAPDPELVPTVPRLRSVDFRVSIRSEISLIRCQQRLVPASCTPRSPLLFLASSLFFAFSCMRVTGLLPWSSLFCTCDVLLVINYLLTRTGTPCSVPGGLTNSGA
jgi:hypothetical protein